MYNFWIQAVSQYRGLNDWCKAIPFIANFILNPVVTILMWAVLGKFAINAQAAIFFSIGQMASMAALDIFCVATMSYANERWYSTLAFVYITPVRRFVNFASRALLLYPIGLIVYITCLIMIRLTTPVDFGAINWPGLVISLLVLNLSIVAFAQFLGIFVIVIREWNSVMVIAVGLILILTGVVIPISVFPAGVQEIVKCLPITNALFAIRSALEGGAFFATAFDLLREVITGAVYFLIGYLGFVAFEKAVRRGGLPGVEDLL